MFHAKHIVIGLRNDRFQNRAVIKRVFKRASEQATMEFESGGGDGGGGLSSAAVVGIRGDEAEGEDVEKPPWRERSSGGVESEVSRGECGSGHEGQIQASADSDGGEEREARPGGEVELGSEVSRGECGSGHEGQIQASADPEDSVEATRLRDEMVGQSPKSLGVEEPEGSKKRKRSAERGVMGEGAQKRRCVMRQGCRHTESVAEPESSDAQRRGRSRGRPRKRGRRSLESQGRADARSPNMNGVGLPDGLCQP